MEQTKKNGALVSIIAMMFLFAMIAFVTNMAAPFGTIWKEHYSWAGMVGNLMNFLAYLFMGIPAGMMITKIGYKKTALVALALGFIGVGVQFLSSLMDVNAIFTFVVYLLGAFICGFCVCILNTVVNPMLNLLGGGGNRGNQLIQTGGTLNSLAATLTPMLAGIMIGEITKDTSLTKVQPLLLIAMAIFAVSFAIIYFTKLIEPATEKQNVMEGVKGALKFRHLVLGIIAIFFYVGIEIGIPMELNFYVTDLGFEGAAAAGGTLAAAYWLLMMIGRACSSAISGKVSTKLQLTTVSAVAILLLVIAIFMSEDVTISFSGHDVPAKAFIIPACGLCTSIMWGGIFNLSVEGLGKYTEAASGIFMTMVVGGGVMPLIQEAIANSAGPILSYWLVIAMLAYILFYALIGCKNVNTDIKVD